jgi:hypothetical protein
METNCHASAGGIQHKCYSYTQLNARQELIVTNLEQV